MIKIIIADNQKLFRQTLKSSLEATRGVTVVGEVERESDLISCYRSTHPDLVLIDPALSEQGDNQGLVQLFQYDLSVRVVMVTMLPFQTHRLKVCGKTVSGFFSKHCGLSELVDSIEKVHLANREGRLLKTLLSQDLMQKEQALSSEQGSPSMVERLSKREFQIFSQLLSGKQTMDIAESFFISPKTVSVHKSNIMKKLGVRNNMDLFKVGIQFGMVRTTVPATLI
ncbi:MAG: response regulator transcription factor [Gammaproteobacteria bacterium]|jgi:two-component system, NarL family, invasion response regulator UvrY|nr:response regulator transcription factor [Gammaproteobacteria bacterium]